MTFPESAFFIFMISAVLAIPIGIAVRTLLAMKERVFVPILRVRTASGDIQTIVYQRIPLVILRDRRFMDRVALIPSHTTQSRRGS
jgi:hypothetical protein